MEQELEITPHTIIPILKDELASRDEYRKMTTRGRETYEFPFDRLKVREGHNGRTKDNPGFTRESLEELARSIFHEGLQEPITIDALKNGDGIITKGERRWRAIGIIRSWIAEGKLSELFSGNADKPIPTFDKVECFINPARITQKDRDMMMLLENMARVDLTPLEQAESIERLKLGGMSSAQIAKSVPGLSTMMVSLRLTLASATEAEKDLIREGKISPTAAVKLIKEEEDPEKRIEMINEAAAGEDGKFQIRNIASVDLDTGEVLSEEEAADALRNSDLKTGSDSEPIDIDDDKSMRGTSPRASTPTGDPAQKAKDDIDQADERITSGRATAHDMVLKVIEVIKLIDTETEGFQVTNPKLTTHIYDADRLLTDLKAILKR